jgi:hypothetical protein
MGQACDQPTADQRSDGDAGHERNQREACGRPGFCAFAESMGADSVGALFASDVLLDMGAGPPSGSLLASTDVGAGCLFDLDAGATSGASLLNSADSRGSSRRR